MPKLICTLLVLGSFYIGISQENVFDASRSGDIAQLKTLIELNKDTINSIDENGFSPLILAAYRNQTECAKFLIDNGANVDYSSPEGTALHAVCYKGNLEIAALLLGNNESINALNSRGTTCLIYAIQSGKLELVKLLLLQGADKQIKDEYGLLPMDYAKRSESGELIALLSD